MKSTKVTQLQDIIDQQKIKITQLESNLQELNTQLDASQRTLKEKLKEIEELKSKKFNPFKFLKRR